MNYDSFPIETTSPKAKLTLPVGTHQIRLTVRDDAGTISQPDTVTIVVKQIGLPDASHIDPPEGRRGYTIDAMIHGINLQGSQSVTVYRGATVDEQITVTVGPGGTAETVPVSIQVSHRAVLGGRTLEVTTPRGTTTVPFNVIQHEMPVILGCAPSSSPPSYLAPVPTRIEGEHFEDASDVIFFQGTEADSNIGAIVRHATEEFLDVDLAISANAEFGRRRFAVTTPAGTTESPPNVTLTVVPGYLAVAIMVLTITTALIHLTLDFPNMLFILNGLGYLALLAAMYVPIGRIFTGMRPIARWTLIGYALVTIVAWIAMGDRTTLAYFTKAVEALLIVLLFVESRRP